MLNNLERLVIEVSALTVLSVGAVYFAEVMYIASNKIDKYFLRKTQS